MGIAVGFKRKGSGERGFVTGDSMMMMMMMMMVMMMMIMMMIIIIIIIISPIV